MNKSILVLPGDGIGQEVTESALTILYELDRRYNLNLDVSIMDVGGTSYEPVSYTHLTLPTKRIV